MDNLPHPYKPLVVKIISANMYMLNKTRAAPLEINYTNM